MHPYATDSSERRNIPLGIAIISILSAWILNKLLLDDFLNLTSLWWLEAPSLCGFYGLFYTIFDKYLWRARILRKFGLIKIPDLNGNWKGCISSSFESHEREHDAIIEIIQSWTRVSINLRTCYSESHSLSGIILTEDQNAIIISYEYLNEPKYNTLDTLHMHRGTCQLTLSPNRQEFSGNYYTGRDRQNFGTLCLKKI